MWPVHSIARVKSKVSLEVALPAYPSQWPISFPETFRIEQPNVLLYVMPASGGSQR
jgi:hypothetical protein